MHNFAPLQIALTQIAEVMGTPYEPEPEIKAQPDDGFWAVVSRPNGIPSITVSTGCEAQLRALWKGGLDDGLFRGPDGSAIVDDIDWLTSISMSWLIMHELEHYTLGHFDLGRTQALTEGAVPAQFDLVQRTSSRKPDWWHKLPEQNRLKVQPCLELQADHEAIEYLLDAYSPDHWDELRVRAACISAVMVLIERQDLASGTHHTTHPLAATRIYQLLGHLSEMWSIPARMLAAERGETVRAEDLPSEEEKAAFRTQVVIPTFLDAVTLARVADVPTIRNDLGDPTPFFEDIGIARRGDVARFPDLQTNGAREWARLVATNVKILPLLSITSP
ncbi:hypothetical protein [Celeribacter naphthalenivorans]|uniref:hypothetical protein n=1 Tax=Celeribacter naphthalenivorans TaxID=1614694 RepID=UPI001CFB24DB|nr:hypothetical protein [Celeribacter naphthalenivorans]